MIDKYRQQFNEQFNEERYRHCLEQLQTGYPTISFRVSETPIFIPDSLREKLIEAGDDIIRLIRQANFKQLTESAIPEEWKVPNENDHPHFLTFDFGICKDETGELIPKLIELQGFPSLYGFQAHLARTYQEVYSLDSSLSPYFHGMNEARYFDLLRKVIVGKYLPEEVVLMDLDAPQQKTAIDFYVTAQKIGVKILSVDEILQEGSRLFYRENGRKIRIQRIYNRLIFDELGENTDLLKKHFNPLEELEIEWITHPNWFYRISKFTMPFLQGVYIPETHFLHELETFPVNLENYVLKPLFSFAGMGVIIDVSEADIRAIKDPSNWILQRKVSYEPVIESPEGGVKAEIRLMYLWPDGEDPILCLNLARMSRGKMIGVRYNKDFNWVGGTVGFMV